MGSMEAARRAGRKPSLVAQKPSTKVAVNRASGSYAAPAWNWLAIKCPAKSAAGMPQPRPIKIGEDAHDFKGARVLWVVDARALANRILVEEVAKA